MYREGENWEELIQRHLVQCQMYQGEDDPEPLIVLVDRIAACFARQEQPLPFPVKLR